jgi:hypothetical protein
MISLADICPTWPDHISAETLMTMVSQQSEEFWSGGADGFLLRVSRSSSAAASERMTALSTDVWGRSFDRSATKISTH